MYVLDSSAIIELLADAKRAESVVKTLRDEPLATTTIALHEVLVTTTPIEQLRINALCGGIVLLAHDERSARIGAEVETELIKTGNKINRTDILVAAICKANNAHLITFDKDFAKIKGLSVTVL
ncbi:type II toxin-antitoxin system VapC family toxin [Candidatus Woesearchaeota archaeon]|nr:MAG: type II toxin-antitoxin system VapC family toxin [Candidatus Woesearchaeota archaeon]